jgi:hypothetical protein
MKEIKYETKVLVEATKTKSGMVALLAVPYVDGERSGETQVDFKSVKFKEKVDAEEWAKSLSPHLRGAFEQLALDSNNVYPTALDETEDEEDEEND